MVEEEIQHYIEKAKSNPNDFKPVYEKYYKRIFRFLLKRHADIDTAEELSAQTFLKALTNINKYSYKGVPFSSWLYKIALNESNLYYRMHRKNQVVFLNEDIVEQISSDSSANTDVALFEHLTDAIQKLKKRDVELIQLRFYEGLSFSAIGDIVGITENNAKVRCYRILDKIRLLMPQNEV